MPAWSTWMGLVTSLAFGGVVKVANGFASYVARDHEVEAARVEVLVRQPHVAGEGLAGLEVQAQACRQALDRIGLAAEERARQKPVGVVVADAGAVLEGVADAGR